MKHFIDISEISKLDMLSILNNTKKGKNTLKEKGVSGLSKSLKNKTIAMIFEKPSTRTRVSFEVGINQLGGNAIILKASDLQLSRGESVSDTAKVLSRYVDGIVIRCYNHEKMLELSSFSSIPVINGLTDLTHPCQVMADIFTIQEHFGSIENKNIIWIGDGNNVANSWLQASTLIDFNLTICTPNSRSLEEISIINAKNLGASIHIENNPPIAMKDKDVVVTDTWISMGDQSKNLENTFKPFQVNKSLMELTSKESIFLHCLPAHRGYEVTNDIIDGEKSLVFEEAENRLHIQRSILEWCFSKNNNEK